jgi:magnesium transporter
MPEVEELRHQESVQEHLREVQGLLNKHELVEKLVHRQEMQKHDLVETLVHKQHLVELRKKLDSLHPADVAYILEALPLEQRLAVWDLVKADREGEILLELSDSVRESLIAEMNRDELLAATENLNADEIADLAPDLPRDVVQGILQQQDEETRAQLQSALSYPKDSVGALMDFELVTLREDISVEIALRYLRRFDELPSHTDVLFVVGPEERLRGILHLQKLLINQPDARVADLMETDVISFEPFSPAAEAAEAFDRYDLISAPVVDPGGKLIGRLTVDQMVDFIRERAEEEALQQAGLREEEDLFASVWKSAKNRWLWLAINLMTAFIASQVIGVFEGSLEKMAILATLQFIVAGIGGNSANQTTAIMIRSIALGQVTFLNMGRLVMKEWGINFLNGLVWGGIAGLFAYLLYRNAALGLVMTASMLLNLLVGALVGIFVPLVMQRLGRDPAVGSSVLLTFTTDCMGFSYFLGLPRFFCFS